MPMHALKTLCACVPLMRKGWRCRHIRRDVSPECVEHGGSEAVGPVSWHGVKMTKKPNALVLHDFCGRFVNVITSFGQGNLSLG
eukprot:3068747-Amphidinium_carterae.1